MNLSDLFMIGKSLTHTALFLKEDKECVDVWLDFISWKDVAPFNFTAIMVCDLLASQWDLLPFNKLIFIQEE